MFTTILSVWRPASPPCARRLPRTTRPVAAAVSEMSADEEQPFCGWHESSRDLWSGIDLREMAWSVAWTDAESRRQPASPGEAG